MTDPVMSFIAVLVQQGGLGILAAFLLLACIRLVKRNDTLQEKRIEEGKGWQNLALDSTAAMRELTEAQRAQNAVIGSLSESVRSTTAALQAMAVEVAKANASVQMLSAHIAQLQSRGPRA
jgi:hypothetical protein